MAQQVELNVKANTSESLKALGKLEKELKKVTEAGNKNREAFDVMDKATGGYVSRSQKLTKVIGSGIKAIKGFSFSLKGLKSAFISTGIGALVVGAQLLYENFDKVKALLTGVSGEAKLSAEQLKKLKEESDALAKSISSGASELLAIQRAYENGTLKGKQLEQVVKELNSKYKDANIQLDENNKLTENSLIFIDAQIEAIKSQAKNKAIQTKIEELYTQELIAQQEVGIKNIQLQQKADEIRELQLKKASETNAFAIEKLEKSIKARTEELKGIAGEVGEAVSNREKIQTAIDNNLDKLDFTGFVGKVDEAVDNKGKKAREKFLKSLEEDLEVFDIELGTEDLLPEEVTGQVSTKEDAEVEALRLKYEMMNMTDLERLNFEEQLELQKLEGLENTEDARLSIETAFAEKRTKLNKDTAEANKKIAEAESQGKITALKGYASALGDVSGVLGEETEAGKMLAVASSLINTYAAIAGQLKAFSTKAIPGYAIAQAIATGAVGFANVKKILSVKVPNSKGGGSAGAGVGGAAPQAPSFNIVGATETSQLAEAIGETTQEPVQAYVVANDVTTAQSLQNNIVEGATL